MLELAPQVYPWVCGTDFLDARIPRYGARLHDLRARGFVTVRRACENPAHSHRSGQFEWRLVARPAAAGQQSMVLGG